MLTVTIPQTSFTALIGTDRITINCSVSGTPPATSVTWTKTVGGQTDSIDVSSNKYSGSTVSNPSLTIRNLDQTDEGDYVCTAENLVGTANSETANLDVTGSKQPFFTDMW